MFVVALVIFIGFKLLGQLVDFGDDVGYDAFLLHLEEELEGLKDLSRGSSISLASLKVPEEVKEICFIGQATSPIGVISNQNLREVINDPVVRGDNTVFLFLDREDRFYEPMRIENVYGSRNPLCVETEGSMNLRATNKGGYVLVEEL
tara:strand:- start:158 stop:601 length:444 start_codon:yes stop_codon:yes gene_type:complete